MSGPPPGDRVPGVATHNELILRFGFWIQQQRHEPSADHVASIFNVHRSTAHRWLRDARNARGAPTA
ncbi:hypothetical protein ISP17_13525 [Dyella ginsengisoli]|jgi:hypothetical protein|uniref:Helix-turn-helix domain-containing protein n=1 Tax=Dyella ginsengisoli TaxID=363848 RepID=A0ABW8JXS2_9GAMM